MDFDSIARTLWNQFVTVWNAPVPFLAALLIVGYVIWKVVQWQFGVRLANLTSQLDLYREVSSLSSAATAEATPDPPAEVLPRITRADPSPNAVPRKELQKKNDSEHSERVFLDDAVTLNTLKRLAKDNTALGAEDASSPYVGKWMRLDGLVFNVTRSGRRIAVALSEEGQVAGLPVTHVFFSESLDQVSKLQKGDRVQIAARFKKAEPVALTFTDGELIV